MTRAERHDRLEELIEEFRLSHVRLCALGRRAPPDRDRSNVDHRAEVHFA
jgi:hypothetical protein